MRFSRYDKAGESGVRINGKLFLILLGLATLALAVTTLWLWPRLSGRGARPVAGRVALLLGTQLSLAATFLFTVNALGGFYTSWGQLFGTASSQYKLADAGVPRGNAADGSQLLGPAADGHGQTGRITGLRSGLTAQVAVFTPAGYAVSGAGGTAGASPGPTAPSGPSTKKPKPGAGSPATTPPPPTYPVEVVDLTGGTEGQQLPDFQRLATTYKVIVAVVTNPSPTSTPPSSPSSPPSSSPSSASSSSSSSSAIPGVNVPDGPQGELFWGQDLRTALAAHYRLDANPADWGVAGVGASGGAAVNLAVQDSTRYGLAAAVGDWTSAPQQDDWPGIDRYLAGAPAPAVRLLYNAAAPAIPGKIQTSDGPLLVAGQSNLDLTSALDWLGASIDANSGVPA